MSGGSARQLTFDRESASFPSISTSGQWIVYELLRGDNLQIAVMDSNGGRQQVLTEEPGEHFPASFSADDRRIAYAGFLDGVWNLYWIDRITRQRKQVTHYTAFGSFVRYPGWRPGTEQMAYEYCEAKGNVDLVQLPPQ